MHSDRILDCVKSSWPIRPRWECKIKCPDCKKRSHYGLSIHGGMDIMPIARFYCDCCNNIYVWQECPMTVAMEFWRLMKTSHQDAFDFLQSFLPSCPCGGHFSARSQTKCVHCGHEFVANQPPEEVNPLDRQFVFMENGECWTDVDKRSFFNIDI